jgi:hypothetical protein
MNVTLPSGSILLSGNPVRITVNGAPAPAGATQHRFLCRVTFEDGQSFTDAIAVDDQLTAYFDIQGYVDIPVTRQFSFSWPPAGGYVEHYTPLIPVEIEVGNAYIDSNGDLQETFEETTYELLVLKGGVSQRQVAIWKANGQNFASTYAGKFLTQRPQDDIVHPYQSISLWYINVTEVTKMQLVCYYSDGTSTTKDVPMVNEEHKLYELRVNPYYNDVPLTSGSAKMVSFTAGVYNNTTLVSDLRRFTFDQRYIERPFWLMFTNSLGGIDDVYLSGYATEGFETEGTTVYKPAQPNDTVQERTLYTPNKQGKNRWRINTGPKSATQMLHLRDLMLSREVWLLYPNNGVSSYYVIPVSITNTSADLVKRSEDHYSTDIEMEEAHNSPFNFDNRLY